MEEVGGIEPPGRIEFLATGLIHHCSREATSSSTRIQHLLHDERH